MNKKLVGTPSHDTQIDQLKEWAKEAEKEIQQVSASMAPLQEQLGAAKERLDLIYRLLRLAAREEGAQSSDPDSSAALQSTSQPTTTKMYTLPVEYVNWEINIEGVLEEAGKPMHIKEIRQSLIDKGVPLPGRGDEANIIVRLRRAPDRFVRTGRGTYGLSSWGLAEVTPTRKKRVIRKRAKR